MSGMSIMTRFKTETANLHRWAEQRPLQRAMLAGRVSPEQFAAMLGQLLLIHEALESCCFDSSTAHPATRCVLSAHHQRSDQIRADRAFHLGRDEVPVPMEPTLALLHAIDAAAADGPVALLGMVYVLEGSTNGSRFIARALRRAWNLPTDEGVASLDPHGPLQMQRWQDFRASMDSYPFTATECDAMVDAAQQMFQAVGLISDELMPATELVV